MIVPPSPPVLPWFAADSLPQVIGNLTDAVTGFLMCLGTLFLTLGGLRYLTANGDPSELERARTALRSAALGYLVAMLAPALMAILHTIATS